MPGRVPAGSLPAIVLRPLRGSLDATGPRSAARGSGALGPGGGQPSFLAGTAVGSVRLAVRARVTRAEVPAGADFFAGDVFLAAGRCFAGAGVVAGSSAESSVALACSAASWVAS